MVDLVILTLRATVMIMVRLHFDRWKSFCVFVIMRFIISVEFSGPFHICVSAFIFHGGVEGGLEP